MILKAVVIVDVKKKVKRRRRRRRRRGNKSKDKDKVDHGLNDELRISGSRKIGMAISAAA